MIDTTVQTGTSFTWKDAWSTLRYYYNHTNRWSQASDMDIWNDPHHMRDLTEKIYTSDSKCIITANASHLGTVMNTKSEMEGKKKMVLENETQKIKKVIFSDPATIVLWEDGTKTVVKTQKGDQYDPEKGLAMACMRKILDKKDYHKWLDAAQEALYKDDISIWINKMLQ